MSPNPTCRRCGNAVPVQDQYCAHCGAAQATPTGQGAPIPQPLWDKILDLLKKAALPKFQVQSLLGYGGMAGVYLAFEPKLGRDVAIKVMAPSLMVDESLVKRFLQEAMMRLVPRQPGRQPVCDSLAGR